MRHRLSTWFEHCKAKADRNLDLPDRMAALPRQNIPQTMTAGLQHVNARDQSFQDRGLK